MEPSRAQTTDGEKGPVLSILIHRPGTDVQPTGPSVPCRIRTLPLVASRGNRLVKRSGEPPSSRVAGTGGQVVRAEWLRPSRSLGGGHAGLLLDRGRSERGRAVRPAT